jgi:hypothetical protein
MILSIEWLFLATYFRMLHKSRGEQGGTERRPISGCFASLELLEKAGFPFAPGGMVQYR